MSRWAGAALSAAILSGCAGRAARPAQPLPPGHVAPAPPAVIPAQDNLVVSVAEAVGTPEEDTASFTKIFIDGREAGQTAVGPKSQERRWGAVLPPGNHLFRFEYWLLPPVGDWGPLGAQWQPTERFIRVEGGARTAVTLKFYDGARRHDLQIAR